jgi:hypothetical protein
MKGCTIVEHKGYPHCIIEVEAISRTRAEECVQEFLDSLPDSDRYAYLAGESVYLDDVIAADRSYTGLKRYRLRYSFFEREEEE